LKQLKRTEEGAKIGIDEDAVIFSVYCAIVHVIFEFMNLIVEAKTSQTPFVQYVVTCYNSREKWMPRQGKFQKESISPDELTKSASFMG
jgi:hypothetical protein